MRNVDLLKLLLLAVIISVQHLTAQTTLSPQVLSTSGRDFKNAQFQLTYTIGEISAVSTLSAGNAIATQGFNQPDKFTIAFVDDPGFGIGVNLFPNPAATQILIDFERVVRSGLRIAIFDAGGRQAQPPILINKQAAQDLVAIPVNTLAAGVYSVSICPIDEGQCTSLRFTKLP
jgi:hypothetical protein